jgi:UDP-2-acetamido-2,6-beta-L-arabino-hexul-4-ose reductase
LQVEPSSASPPRSPLPAPCSFLSVPRSFRTTLGELADRIRSFRASRKTLLLPSFADDFTRCLYATYLSYLDGPDFAYSLDLKTDNRGCLAEFMKSPAFGQIFVSRTKPGITRGNHYHHTKTEKFLVLEGEAIIRFRPVAEQGAERPERGIEALHSPLIEHRVCGRDFRVVDIPPGYTHSIENIGATELITLFWASEIFDPTHPDTYALPVE